jgi:hypothetical protein
MAAMFQVDVFWNVMPCSVVLGHRHFRGPCCLHLELRCYNLEMDTSKLINVDNGQSV